jgi:sulfite reductase beta subunit-like hemoprotein
MSNQMPQALKDLILKSHGGMLQRVAENEAELKANALRQLRELSNQHNKGE